MIIVCCVILCRCDPNPCEHGGICSQNYIQFDCDCDATGYEGGVCHKSKYMISCDEALELNPLESAIETTIDIDDSGPLEPFAATCVFQRKSPCDASWRKVVVMHITLTCTCVCI